MTDKRSIGHILQIINGYASRIINGTTDVESLSELAEGKLIHKIPKLKKALKGSIRFHQMQMLKLQMEHIDFLTKSIEEMDADIKKKRNP